MPACWSSLLTFLLATTCTAAFADSCALNVVCTGPDLVAALQNDSLHTAEIRKNVRLASNDWPANIIRTRNFTLKGSGASNVLLDLSELNGRLTLAPGVVLVLQDLECRNAGGGVGFGLNLLTASPGARVELRNAVIFTFVCLPLEFLLAVIRSYRSTTLPPEYALDAQQRIAVGGRWCRATHAIALCYNSTVELTRSLLPLGANTTSDLSYIFVAYNSTLVCQEETTVSCGRQEGYSACLDSRRAQLRAKDNTWDQLLTGSATGIQPGPTAVSDSADDGGGDGSGRRMGAGRLAGVVVGAVLGALLLLLVVVVMVVVVVAPRHDGLNAWWRWWWRNRGRRRIRSYQQQSRQKHPGHHHHHQQHRPGQMQQQQPQQQPQQGDVQGEQLQQQLQQAEAEEAEAEGDAADIEGYEALTDHWWAEHMRRQLRLGGSSRGPSEVDVVYEGSLEDNEYGGGI